MRIPFKLKDLIIVVTLSIIFSYISWSVLITTKKAQVIIRQDISESVQETQSPSIKSFPRLIILPIIAYFPFWAVTIGLIRIFTNLEKQRKRLRIY